MIQYMELRDMIQYMDLRDMIQFLELRDMIQFLELRDMIQYMDRRDTIQFMELRDMKVKIMWHQTSMKRMLGQKEQRRVKVTRHPITEDTSAPYLIELPNDSTSVSTVEGETTTITDDEEFGVNTQSLTPIEDEDLSSDQIIFEVLSKDSTLVARSDENPDEEEDDSSIDGGEEGSESSSTSDDQSNSHVHWEIINLDSDGRIDWSQEVVYTDSIAGYEEVFQQDLNNDGSIGISISDLTTPTDSEGIPYDSYGYQIKVSDAGTVHLWDGVTEEFVTVKDINGGSPQMVVNDEWGDYGSFKVIPYAAVKVDDYIQLAIKTEEKWTYIDELGVEEKNERIEWDIRKVSLEGVLDSSSKVFTTSIIPWEPIFDQDMNGDGDKSGTVSITLRDSETEGIRIGDADGQLYIVDSEKQIAVSDPWIEDNHDWGDGSYKSTAIAVEKNNNNTSTNANDDYYQLAVKQENEWTDFWTGQKNSDVSWQIYAVEDDGQINWEKTIWTQSISGFETFFGTDLDEDGVSGINSSDLAFAPLDQYGYRLKKDEDNLLYIVDSNDENTISVSDEYGGFPSFDWSHNWGSGSHNSSAVAVEQNSDNTFSLAVKHEDTWDGETHLNWEILSNFFRGSFELEQYCLD